MKEKLTNTTIYRYGGDEFLLIRDDVDIDLFEKQLDSVKKELSSFNSSREGEKVYFSLGYVYGETKTSYDLRNMFEKADDRNGTRSAAGEYGGEYVRRYIT